MSSPPASCRPRNPGPPSPRRAASAGSYHLDQPAIANALGEKKARDVLPTGNIRCLTQLRAHFAKLGSPLPIRHTIEAFCDAYHAASPRL